MKKTVSVKARSKGELEEKRCPSCNSAFRVNPRKKRKKVYCPVCGFKMKLEV